MRPQEHPRGQQQRVILVELGELGVAPVVRPHICAVQQRDTQVVVPDLHQRGRVVITWPVHAGSTRSPDSSEGVESSWAENLVLAPYHPLLPYPVNAEGWPWS